MIYAFLRSIAGKYINSFVDYYIANQFVFNSIIVVIGFLWLCYSYKLRKGKHAKKTNFFGAEIQNKKNERNVRNKS